ncbi:uncharacterized protein [Salminus brasiliensis]|uniref:uncharacterized protein isoform X2 n=1 Tax=Salminus brasiliensis TaxID=930266 RepID=UPI003B834D10
MDMKHILLILSVSLFPGFLSHRLYVSDEVTLRCKDGGNVLASGVTWFFKGNPIPTSNATLKFPAVTVDDSGTYQCEHGGQKSEAVEIKVLDMLPQASLSVLNNADTVIGKGGAVLLKLYMEEGLNDWWCRYTEGDQEMWQPIKRDPTQSNSSLIIHADVGEGDGRTYWCMDAKKGLTREERSRSNAIKLTATGKMVMLQMSEKPAWSGDDVTVSCDVWGGPKVDQAVFYKDGREITGIQKVSQNKFTIQNITKSSEGVYHCDATYRFIHISKDAATHSNLPSDQQVLTVIAGPPKPRLDCTQMKCEGQWSSKPDSYLWLYTPEGATDPEKLQESKDQILSGKTGTYTCSAKWTGSGFSRKSNECRYAERDATKSNIWVVVVVLLMVVVFLLLVALCMCKRHIGRYKVSTGKKERETGSECELQSCKKENDKGQYETLKDQGKGEGKGSQNSSGRGEHQ